MSQNQDPNACNHDCSSCGTNCPSRQDPASFLFHLSDDANVKKHIGIVSGKGGVGKSFVTSLLASEFQRQGYQSAVLDGDITGPSQGQAFGLHDKAMGDGKHILPALSKTGIQVITANMLLERENQPVIWRGPMVAGILKQFYEEVFWKDVDYLFVDMPPGTSDVPLTAFQSIPLDGIVIVTSPQELVGKVVEKAINMANMMDIPVLGLIENMSYVECDGCGKKLYVFGKSHVQEIADQYQLDVLAQIPLRPEIAKAADDGDIDELIVPEITEVFTKIMDKFE